jgi:PTS system mannose-specific IIC component
MSLALAVLLVWGIVVGVDLVSFPQGLLSRPLVAASVAGAILGDPHSGLRVGVILELFALDVLPIGASRYPDYGPGAVVAGAFAAGGSGPHLLGPAVLLGVLLAIVGGRSIEGLRRLNGGLVRRAEPALAKGDRSMVRHLFWVGISADAARSLGLTAFGLSAVVLLRWGLEVPVELGQSLGLVAIAGGILGGVNGILRRSGGTPLIGFGLVLGMVVAWIA